MSKKDFKRLDKYKDILYDITSIKSRSEYEELRKICKEIYLKTLNNKSEIRIEKERVKNNLESIKSPYFQMALGLTVSFISFIVTFYFGNLLKESEIFLFIGFCMFSIMLYIFFLKTISIFLESERKVNAYNICINVLDELENEMIISDKINNNSAILKEIAINDIEDDNKINRAKN
ncbi:hypothetical protein GCM10008908_09260 [Clostridium subterminale]|uniref:SMODS and SLOG-associating 2TM effector domain-containing protein n=1 Tax=Clostridium subterminale TaxID=1550 RepID=A0ABN1KJF4_CLOSU